MQERGTKEALADQRIIPAEQLALTLSWLNNYQAAVLITKNSPRKMEYYFNKIITGSFEEVIQRVKETLSKEGFGVLTEIDFKAVMKAKLDENMYNYKISGDLRSTFVNSLSERFRLTA